jgi:hypothetical protein
MTVLVTCELGCQVPIPTDDPEMARSLLAVHNLPDDEGWLEHAEAGQP